jgi:hypothetical protein
MQIDITGKPIK